jgi:MFS family permease
MMEPLSRPTPGRILILLSLAELMGMSPWFAASAIAPQLAARWSLDPAQVGALTSAVQLGFVAGTALAALFNLADLLPARAYFAACALLAGAANLALMGAPGYGAALGWRFATGLFLAGVYPPAMKMIATWFRERRGLAIGVMVGALAAGKGLPYLVRALGSARWENVLLATSAQAALA